MVRTRSFLPLSALLLAGCGEVAAEGDFPGAVVYAASDGAFRLRYLDPPWSVQEADPPTVLRLIAEIRGGAVGDVASDAPTHLLEISPMPQSDAASACLAAEAEAVALGAQVRVQQRSVDTLFGDLGHEFLSTDPLGLNHRDAFFTTSDGGVLRLGFATVFDPDDEGIDVILDGFEPL